ncbi:DMT family transporter [Salipiger abyssi]|uniref:DMT family transporter n=1 Tax=Salipiger abyssi TaxID=1250539 RepID=UPI004059591C
MTHAEQSPGRNGLTGLAFGLLTVLIWSAFNVGSKIGTAKGFGPVDLMVLRFSIGSLFMLPMLLIGGRGVRVPPRRILVLLILGGPLFATTIATGFALAPLSHGVILGPCASICVANALIWCLGGQRLARRQVLAIAVMMSGLVLIALDAAGGGAPVPMRQLLLGDAAYFGAGSLWGTYIYLLSRWQMPPFQTAARVTVLAGLLVGPAYLLLSDPPALPVADWLEQGVYQGLLAGAMSFATFAATVTRLGAARASLFMAMVPPVALLMAIPLLGSIPTPLQGLAIAVSAIGILLSIERRKRS